MPVHKLFVTGHKGFESALFRELRELLTTTGARLKKVYGGVEVMDATLEPAYRLCLGSRLANRVFYELGRARAEDAEQLYQAVYEIDWETHFGVRNSFAVSSTVSNSRLDHAQFVSLKCKDAVVDRFRDRCGGRPVVEKSRPDIRIHLHLHRDRAVVSLDLSGDSLHKRGYRAQNSAAPLREHLAAAMLMQAGWSAETAAELRFVDPMCGSGTFAIEAAMIGAKIAPGLERNYYGFDKWLLHDPVLWQRCIEDARAEVDENARLSIYASDSDGKTLDIARTNAERAGVTRFIHFQRCEVGSLELPPVEIETLVFCNPPWGRRLRGAPDLGAIYQDLGDAVRRLAPARLGVFSANPELLHRLRLLRQERKPVRNGALDCLFAIFKLEAQAARDDRVPAESRISDDSAEPLRNRLRKNIRHLSRWAKRSGIRCYRVYDADLPEFAFALDRYESELEADYCWFHLQEYRAPASIDSQTASARIELARVVLCAEFGISGEQLFCKTRSRQRGSDQYRKHDNRGEMFQVREGEVSLLVNLSDYLDTGLFLDHRLTRQRIHREAAGKSLLNLFCYTAAAGVHAAAGGANSVVNVDLSSTYLDWARENHRLNGFIDESRYRFLRADILELLKNPARFSLTDKYDLIFLDPPSFSNSSSMRQTLDIQRDHADLLRQAMQLLAADGLLLFSTNRRGFRLDDSIEAVYATGDITRATLPEDFKRNPGIHRCWEIRHPG